LALLFLFFSRVRRAALLAVHSLSRTLTRRTMSGSEAAAAGATIVSPKPVAAAVAPVVMADAQAEADAAAAAAAARAHAAAAADQQGEVRFSSPPLTQVGTHSDNNSLVLGRGHHERRRKSGRAAHPTVSRARRRLPARLHCTDGSSPHSPLPPHRRLLSLSSCWMICR
jgi:hypothetical protein